MRCRAIPRILALLVLAAVGGNAFAQQACAADEKRLHAGDECIPVVMFNYLYCLENSGGGVVQVTRKSGDDSSHSVEVQVGANASGVVLKGGGSVGFKKGDVGKATREIQETLSADLANKCESFAKASGASGASAAAKRTDENPVTRRALPIESNLRQGNTAPTSRDPRGAFSGFSCTVSSYGNAWAEETREKIRHDLDTLYGCTETPDASMKPGFSGDFHYPASPTGAWSGFAANSTVLYYSDSNKILAQSLASDLTARYHHHFYCARGGGQGINPGWYQRTIVIHLRENGT